MSDRPRTGASVELNGPGSTDSAQAVAKDFEALVAILDRQLELVPSSDEHTRTHIAHAKAAAERGALLARNLLERIHSEI